MSFSKVLETLTNKSSDIFLAISILIVFWIMSIVFKTMAGKVLNKKSPNSNISVILSSIVKNVILIIGFITSLGTLGINVSAIVAGLGLTGFAFGFALKDILSNVISGVLILIYQPFKVSDQITIDKYSGKVIDINLRYTTVVSEEREILIPNSFLFSKPISVNK